MIIYLVLILVLCLINIKVAGIGRHKSTDFFADCLDKSSDQTTCIKGVFALIIVVQHARQYFDASNSFGYGAFSFILNSIGQLMVVMFLFYSGFGIVQSYKADKWGGGYFKTFPRTRILKTLVHFDLAVLVFYLISLILHSNYGARQVLLSFVGWDAIGNSNWFIFSILVVYILIYIAHFCTKSPKVLSFITLALTIGFVILLSYYKESWWYSTILTMPMGMLYACYKDKIEGVILAKQAYYYIYLGCLLVLFVCFGLLYRVFNPYQLVYNIYACIFAILVTAVTYKVKISNKVLKFLGVHSFSIYILQRIPMMLLSLTKLSHYPITFTLCSFALTLIIAYAFSFVYKFVDKLFFSKTSKKQNQPAQVKPSPAN